MGIGYTRQSAADIVDGELIVAAPLNTEFNQLESAFNGTTGHSHDGTSGEGPKIDLTLAVSGILPVANGGTGLSAITDLLAIEALAGTSGGLFKTAANTWSLRTLTAPAAGFTITNPAGVAGDPTFVLSDDLAALEGMAGTGIVARTASNTYAQRTLTAPAAGITVSNGDGVAGNPTLALANDLSALEALSGTNTIYYRSGIDTWTAVTIGGLLSFSGGTLNVGDAELTAIAGLTSAADSLPYFTGSGTAALATFTAFGRTLVDDADAATARSTLGLVIGTNVQAYDAELAAIAALAVTDGNFIVGNGTTWVAESGATARTSLGLGSLATASTINDSNWSGTDLAVANGGTGASDAATARTNLGLAIGTNVQAYDAELAAIAALAVTDGNFIVGNGTTWVVESGATARASLGVGTTGTYNYTMDQNVSTSSTVSFATFSTTNFSCTNWDHGTFSATGASNGKQIASGTASTMGSSRNATSLQGHFSFYNGNGQVGSIQTSGSSTIFNTSSDQNLKENFEDFDAGIIIDELNVYKFVWKNKDKNIGYGVKAQEAYNVFPDAISPGSSDDLLGTEEYERWSADYSKFVPLLLREVKALRARVAMLEGGI